MCLDILRERSSPAPKSPAFKKACHKIVPEIFGYIHKELTHEMKSKANVQRNASLHLISKSCSHLNKLKGGSKILHPRGPRGQSLLVSFFGGFSPLIFLYKATLQKFPIFFRYCVPSVLVAWTIVSAGGALRFARPVPLVDILFCSQACADTWHTTSSAVRGDRLIKVDYCKQTCPLLHLNASHLPEAEAADNSKHNRLVHAACADSCNV
jgi:hypothetical protein